MHGTAPDRSLERIGELVAELERLPDPAARAAARELLQFVLDVHGSALARFMALIAADPGHAHLLERVTNDSDIRAVLLLHGLHPDALAVRVERAIKRLRAHLGVQGIGIETVEVIASAVRVQLKSNNARDAHADPAALRREIEAAIFDAAPDVAEIEIEGLPRREIAVPLAAVGGLRKRSAVSSLASP